MSTQVNVGGAAPQGGATGTQGEHHPSTTNVHIHQGGGGGYFTPHASSQVAPENHRVAPRAKYGGQFWAFAALLLALLLWGMMGWPTFKIGSVGGPLPPSTASTAIPEAPPVPPADIALVPVPAPSYTREVPVHDGSSVLCEVTLAGAEAVLGNDEEVMSFVKTNETSLCTSAEGALSWKGENITWKKK